MAEAVGVWTASKSIPVILGVLSRFRLGEARREKGAPGFLQTPANEHRVMTDGLQGLADSAKQTGWAWRPGRAGAINIRKVKLRLRRLVFFLGGGLPNRKQTD